jgi:serine/threonine-protein kinase
MEVALVPALKSAPMRSDAKAEATLLAARLRAFGLISAALQLLTVASVVPLRPPSEWATLALRPEFLLAVLGILGSSLLILAPQLGTPSRSRLRLLESAVIALQAITGSPFSLLAESIAYGHFAATLGPSHTLGVLLRHYSVTVSLLSLSTVLAMRAALVPSSPQRTFWLTALPAAIVVLVCGFGFYPESSLLYPLSWTERVEAGTLASFWAALTVACCVSISLVVYRLRREVQRARALGQYVLEEKLGEGGMGQVFRARHALLKRPVALKLLSPGATEDGGEQALQRFEREVQITSGLTCPHTITIYDYGRTPEGDFYYTMELLGGLDLAELVERYGAQPAPRVTRILEALCRSLAEAHERGYVHRDIKPANVFLCRELGGQADFVKVLDFGLVRETREERLHVTREGVIAGTPMYLAPEVLLAGERASAKSDLYAVGAVGYALLAGREMFESTSVMEVLAAQLHQMPARPSARLGRAVPSELEEVIMACLAKEPDHRPASARELADALSRSALPQAWTDADARSWWASAAGSGASASASAFEATAALELDRTQLAPR